MKINNLLECGVTSDWLHGWRIKDDSLSAYKAWKNELDQLIWAEVSKINSEYNIEISVNEKTIMNTTKLFASNALGKVCEFIDNNIIDIINEKIKE